MTLPYGLPTATGWALSDYITRTVTSSPAGADGLAVATAEQLDPDELWLIDRAVVSCTSVADTALRLYDSQVSAGFLLSGSRTGNFDEADYPTGLQLQPLRQLVAVWTGATPGAVGTINLQARRMLRTGG